MKCFIVLYAIVLLSACQLSSNSEKNTSKLIHKDTLVSVLRELMLVESHVQFMYGQVSIYKDVMKESGLAILKKHALKEDRFDYTMNYYGTHQAELITLYKQVLDSLNQQATKFPQNTE
jgi:hypothetical protein